jgi:RHS repeat-associated protein
VTAGYDGLSRMDALGRASGASTSAIGYDNADRMTTLSHVFTPTTGNEIWGFTFTPASQLATANSTNAAWNWTAASAAAVNTVADGLNRDATVAGVTQTYDKFGNLTSDGTRTFAYDTENRLLTESGPVTLALSYDPMGRLQQSVINGTTTQFLYDGDSLVGEYPATGNTPLRRYVHGAGTDNPLIWYEGGTMTAANANYLITDRQGSIVATAGSSGALAVNYTYDAYGAPNTWGTVGAVPRFRYTGQAAIPEAHLYHYKARVYDPVSGRFLQTDPVGYGPDVNWYAYLGNNPVNKADPTGKGPPEEDEMDARPIDEEIAAERAKGFEDEIKEINPAYRIVEDADRMAVRMQQYRIFGTGSLSGRAQDRAGDSLDPIAERIQHTVDSASFQSTLGKGQGFQFSGTGGSAGAESAFRAITGRSPAGSGDTFKASIGNTKVTVNIHTSSGQGGDQTFQGSPTIEIHTSTEVTGSRIPVQTYVKICYPDKIENSNE